MRTRLANARWLGIALLGTAVAAAVAGFEVAHRAPAPAAVTAMPSPGPPPPVGRPAPSFDVVRVAPDGAAVLAGRATPGAEVTVTAGDRTVGLARANPDGAWLIAPSLPAGPAAVGVSERAPDGRVTAGDAPVLVVVPERTVAAAAQPPALAVMTPPLGPPRVLQAPGMRVARALALDTFDYDEHGAIRFSGTAPPAPPVRAYVDNAAVGDATADGEGPLVAVAAGHGPARLHRCGWTSSRRRAGCQPGGAAVPARERWRSRRWRRARWWCSPGRTCGGWRGARMAAACATPSSSWPTGTRSATPA